MESPFERKRLRSEAKKPNNFDTLSKRNSSGRPLKITFVLFFTTFFNAYNSFFNSFEKTVLGISECSKHKTKVQFLMNTYL